MSDNGDTPTPASTPWVVRIALAATLLITFLCAAVIWYRFVVTPETNCIIAVSGNSSHKNHVVEVIPKVAADPDRARLTVTLSADNAYSARFFLTSGTYRVRVLNPAEQTVVGLTEFVPPGRRWSYDLTRAPALPATAPATLPAAPR